MTLDVARIREGLPDPEAAGARQAAGLPRQRGDFAEAAAGDRRARQLLRELQREHPPRRPRSRRRGDGSVRRGAREGRDVHQRAVAANAIIFTRNTTEAINLVAYTWGRANIREGDEILLTQMEHHSNLIPWQRLAAEKGATVRYIELTEHADAGAGRAREPVRRAHEDDGDAARLELARHDQPGREDRGGGAPPTASCFLVDGAQGAPHLPVDVQAIGATSTPSRRTRCSGPTGVGVLYGAAGAARGDGAVPGRRRDDPQGRLTKARPGTTCRGSSRPARRTSPTSSPSARPSIT